MRRPSRPSRRIPTCNTRIVMSTVTTTRLDDLPSRHAEDKERAIGERNEVEATFGISKRVYRANDIRAKLDDTADTWMVGSVRHLWL